MPEDANEQPAEGSPTQSPPETVQTDPITAVQPAVNVANPEGADARLASTSPGTATPKNRKKVGLLVAAVAAVLVVIGGSAAAYYAVVVPNKPENVLKKAINNTALQKKTKFDGKLNYESTDPAAEVKAVNVTFNGAADTEANNFSSAFEVTASGAKLPIEIRHVDKSIFFKIGDLASVKGLAQTAAPEYGVVVDELNKKVANQWIEVDETLLKQANADCALNTSFALTQEDMDILQKRFQQVPFASVKSTSDDKVNGKSAIKYEIEIDDNKGAEYIKGLDELPLVKKIKECNPNKQGGSADTSSLADNDVTPLTLWVDKGSKQIVKVASHSTKQDEDKDKFKASLEVTMQYGEAPVSKPEGAKPFMQVFGDLSQLLGGIGLGATTGGGDGPTPAHCAQDFQDYATSGGTKPIPADCMY